MLASLLGPHGFKGEELTALDNVWLIISKPDNIPIVMLLIAVGIYTYMSLRDARKHDRLIAQGRKKDVLRAMQD
jgi:hypothetical protein